jgi:thermitase
VLIGWLPESAEVLITNPPTLDEERADPVWQQAARELAARTGLAVLDLHPAYGTARLAVIPGQERAEIGRLAALPGVKYAGLNHLAHAAGYPNDPFIGDQWNLRRVGAPAAWDVTTGSLSIVVAVVDSGVDLSHPEFAGRLLPGYDYVNWDSTPNDDYGHGTHVAGILAAAANNAAGIAGLAPTVKLLPLKVLDATGAGSYWDIATAVRRAADSSAQVINLSLGGFADDTVLRDAVNYALQRNCLVVAAAGNCAQGGNQCGNQVNPLFYPAAYPGVVAVAATDHYDNWAAYSGYRSYVALAAPGGLVTDQIWSTIPGGYGFKYGTSMAAALTSGAAVLAWTLAPAASYAQIADILKNTADKVGPYPYTGGRNDYFGYGRLNVARAVRWAYPPSLRPIADPQYFLLGAPVSQQRVRLPLTNPSDQPVTWQATVIEGTSWLSVSPTEGTATFTVPGALTLQAGPTALAPGHYDGVVRVRVTAPQPASFNIYALLQVKSSLRRIYAPLLLNQSLATAWIDPLTGGQPLNLTNNDARQLFLPFPVHFYGLTYNDLWVSDNGFVSFEQPYIGPNYGSGSCPPTAAGPNDAIYVLWDDLNPGLGGQVYAQQPDSQRYVITWYQVSRGDGTNPQSFQLVLLRDGRLLLQYRMLQTPIRGTIAIENFDGTLGQQIVCHGSGRPLGSGDAVLLQPDVPW